MTAFLFWNINGKDLRPLVTDLVLRHHVDVLMLAESGIQPAALLRSLNRADGGRYGYFLGQCSKIKVFARFASGVISTVEESDRLTIRHVTPPGRRGFILAVVHFPSKFPPGNEASQPFECCELSRTIRHVESRLGHSRTVLVGDLNMNPFEDAVVAANGLHGVMTRDIARRGGRTVHGREYPFFYNPMWRVFGDATPGPAGTHYYGKGGHRVFFWNVFDQVLVRPDLLDAFDSDDLRIITSADGLPLVGPSGRPDGRRASDHLPLFFSLKL